jgi:LL-diaminopimelate aminotransferase
MYTAKRIQSIGSAIFSEMAVRKQQEINKGKSIIDLSIGTPDLPPSESIIEAMRKALLEPKAFHYALDGKQELKEAIKNWYYSRFNVILNSHDEILTLMGSQDGLSHLPLTILDPGDIALVPDPGYPIYFSSIELAHGQVYRMPLTENNNYLPNLNEIPDDIAAKAKLMILNYPSNPVAATANVSFFNDVVKFAQKHNIIVVHDLAYSELCFDGYRPPSFLEADGAKEIGVEINSLSKSYNMAGARFGFIVGNKSVIKNLSILKSNIDYGVFNVVQAGALQAFKEGQDFCIEIAEIYKKRRNLLVDGFYSLGWKLNTPKATMFVWAKIPQGYTSREFAFTLLEKAGIVVIPGDAFGIMGEGYIRIGLVQDEQQIELAIKQLKDSGISLV